MVHKDGAQRYKYGNNSLLQTATSKRLGAARFGSIIGRGVTKAPIKKLKIQKSDESRVSDLSGSIISEVRPTMIKEVEHEDFDVESSILDMSMNSADLSKAFDKENPVVGDAFTMNLQPAALQHKARQETKPAKKTNMQLQGGFTISTPSPIALDRVQVQMGQEHTVPESDEAKEQRLEIKRQQEMKELKEQRKRKAKEQHKLFKEEVKQKVKEELQKEQEEGFEAQLEDFNLQRAGPKKKSLVKKILGKLKPLTMFGGNGKPLTPDAARALARQAMAKSRVKQGNSSISDHDFPILVIDPVEGREDETVSSLGTGHVLEKMMAGHLRHPGRELREPTPTDELELLARRQFAAAGGNALIDKIDSGTMTADAGAMGRCSQPYSTKKGGQTHIGAALCAQGPLNYALAALCLQPNADEDEENAMFSSAAFANGPVKKSLSPIDEGGNMSPTSQKSIPELEDDDQENAWKRNMVRDSSDGIIDLTNLASPVSPNTQDGVKGSRFAFDGYMDVAASKLRNGGDRYAIEGDESPRKGMRADTTPKASGAHNQARRFNVPSDRSSFAVFGHPEGDVLMWSESADKEALDSPIQSLMDSPVDSPTGSGLESPTGSPTKNKGDFPGFFSDGLFGLLSMDESVARGRKKVPFLSNDDPKQNMDPNLGVMCGAVPLYFMYDKMQDNDAAAKAAKMAKGIKTDNESTIISDSSDSDETNDNTEEDQGRMATKNVKSPKKGKSERGVDPKQEVTNTKDKVLLAHDDAYWDTLSTIASTKGKSTASAKVFGGPELLPGPIPNMITMKNKKDDDDTDTTTEHQQKDGLAAAFTEQIGMAIGKLSNLMEDGESTGSLSDRLAAEEAKLGKKASKRRSASSEGDDDIRLSHAATASVGDSFQAPPAHYADERSDPDDIAFGTVGGIVSKFEAQRIMEMEENAEYGSPKNANGLTGVVGGNQGNWSPRQKQTKQNEEDFELGKTAAAAWNGIEPYLSLTPGMATLKNIVGQEDAESKKKEEAAKEGLPSPKWNDVLRKKPADPEAAVLTTASNEKSGLLSSAKNPHRSVSWGFEEIYEAPETVLSADEAGNSTNTTERVPMSAIAAAAASAALKRGEKTSEGVQQFPVTEEPTAHTDPSQLSEEDEQALISRTIQLSKELLSSMTAQDLAGTDDEVVKSLLSFGTEDTLARSSLPEVQTLSSPRGSSTVDASTMGTSDSGVVVPTSVQVDKTKAPKQLSIAVNETDSSQGVSVDAPIDVEGLFSEYDDLAHKLVDENTELKSMIQKGSAPSPSNRMDALRAQRAAALNKFNSMSPRSMSTAGAVTSPTARPQVAAVNRGRDRLGNYGRTARVGNIASSAVLVERRPLGNDKGTTYMDHLETASTTSSMKSTASMKARELRKQLDEALRASKDIRKSQEQLGSELRDFKDKFYKKNDALEGQAMKAIGGLQ